MGRRWRSDELAWQTGICSDNTLPGMKQKYLLAVIPDRNRRNDKRCEAWLTRRNEHREQPWRKQYSVA